MNETDRTIQRVLTQTEKNIIKNARELAFHTTITSFKMKDGKRVYKHYKLLDSLCSEGEK